MLCVCTMFPTIQGDEKKNTPFLLIWDNNFNRMEHSLSLKAESIVSMTFKYYLHLAVPSVLIS